MASNFKINSILKRELRHKLWLKQRGLCWICRTPVIESEGTLDHVQPTSNGGRHGRNVKLACWSCNHGRGNQLASDYARREGFDTAALARILDVERQTLKA